MILDKLSHDEVIDHIGPRLEAFVDAVNELAQEYDVPAYSMMVMTDNAVVAAIGGYDREGCELLAQANIKLADQLKQLMALKMMGRQGKPS